jgi:hypothetical protein
MGIMADPAQSAEQLFGEALDLQPEDRPPFLIGHAGMRRKSGK